MFKTFRKVHKWIGVFACLFLMTIATTGFLLAIKKRAEWLQPGSMKGGSYETPAQVISMDEVFEAVRGEPGFESFEDIDRIDYRPDRNLFKVRSADKLHEVQVDGATGEVLKKAPRNDQLMENIHDMSFFGDALHDWLLPAVAVVLFTLGLTGVVMFFTPYTRRWKFKRKQRELGPPLG